MIQLAYTIAFVLVAFAVPAHAQQSPISVEQFRALDATGKSKTLYDLTISHAPLPIDTLIEMVRIASQLEAADVRKAAMVAVTVRPLSAKNLCLVVGGLPARLQ
jgi:hypothetical protein